MSVELSAPCAVASVLLATLPPITLSVLALMLSPVMLPPLEPQADAPLMASPAT